MNTIANRDAATSIHSYPRPTLRRQNWLSLNGRWRFAIDADVKFKRPKDVSFKREIIVPFAPETKASQIADRSHYNSVWYRRTFKAPHLTNDQRLILHFGAVDWHATIWLNGEMAIEHDGGYTPFEVDITDFLKRKSLQTIEVRAEDNPHDLEKNRGKQDWEEEEHSIWYPRTTGIWQTVWLEIVPTTFLQRIDWSPSIDELAIAFKASLTGNLLLGTKARVVLSCRDEVLADNIYVLGRDEVNVGTFARKVELVGLKNRLELPDDYIDEIRRNYFWHPERPNLIDAVLEILAPDGHTLDHIESYTAFRKAEICGSRILVNGKEEYLRLVLDQGYWAETGMTPPSDDAIKLDIQLMKEAGFNGARKHNKLEDPRFLFWSDVLGFYVWEELPSAYRFTTKAMERSMRTWSEAIERDRNHPCIIAWVPINESWGVPNLTADPLQCDFQRALFRMTKALTGGAIVIGNDGWHMIESDIIAIHDYDADIERIKMRYENTADNRERLFREERPGNRELLLDGMSHKSKPVMLTEFGGIKCSSQSDSWGYSTANSASELGVCYQNLMAVVCALPLLGGFCYTEFTDVYQEANGLFSMDRKPKFPVVEMRRAINR